MNHSASSSFLKAFLVVAIFWMVEFVEYVFDQRFTYYLGLYPRSLHGILGIFTAPFLHGDILHLISNSVPFLLLGGSILFFYSRIAYQVVLQIYFLTGFAVWLLAQSSYHVGASGVIYGFASFLFFSGIFRRDLQSLGIALAVAVLYGGFVEGIFPVHKRVSWESHLFGALAGAMCAYWFRNDKIRYGNDDDAPPPKSKTIHEGYQNIENEHFKYVFKDK